MTKLVGQSITVVSPIYLTIPRKTKKDKVYSLNLNTYRNLHFIVNNQLKEIYEQQMYEKLKNVYFNNPVRLTFVLYKRDRRIIDRSNFLCIVEKFFCDCLTKFSCIPDDNDKYIVSTIYKTGGIDPKNPRVEIQIEELTENELNESSDMPEFPTEPFLFQKNTVEGI